MDRTKMKEQGGGSIGLSEQAYGSTIQLNASRRLSSGQRLALSIILAVLAHLTLLAGLSIWVKSPSKAEPSGLPDRSIEVTLTAPPPEPERPARVESAPPPAPVMIELEDRSHRARAREQATEPPRDPEPATPATITPMAMPTDLSPANEAAQEIAREQRDAALAVLGGLSRFSVETPTDVLPESPSGPADLGGAPRGTLLAEVLDHDEIDLPFADTEMDLVFYSPGVRGDIERFGDAVTKRFGFKTPGGIKVECAWIVVMVACAW